jgi:polyferredoxin
MKKINILLQKWYFPVLLKYVTLLAYIILIVTGLMAYSNDAAFLKQLRNTNLGNLIVWSYWWPAIIIGAIFFGRIWCMVCPVELITTFFAKIGFKRKRPIWLLSGWVITVFYILILFVGIQGFAIHRNPFFMAIYLLSIVGVSIIIGSIYEKNTFCHYVCPVGYLLGLYSRLSFVGWRVKDKNICDSCKDKSCIHNKHQYNLNYKSCGVDLYPANITDNSDCILCAGCLKTCSRFQSHSNPERPNPHFQNIGFASGLFQLKPLRLAEMVFVLVVSGFVISEIWSEWQVTNAYLSFLPDLVINSLSIKNKFLSGLVQGTINFAIVPFSIWLLPYFLSGSARLTISFKDYLLRYGIAFIPIIAAAHIGKSILKSTSRVPYFEHVSDDFSGISTAQKLISGQITLQENPTWIGSLISLLLIGFMIIGIWLSVKVVTRLNIKNGIKKAHKSYYLIPIIYGGIFLIMLLVWKWI